MSEQTLFPVSKTEANTKPLPPLSDPAWDIADMTRDEVLEIARLSLRHAMEHMRVVVAYNQARVDGTEVQRRCKRALALIADAMYAIG